MLILWQLFFYHHKIKNVGLIDRLLLWNNLFLFAQQPYYTLFVIEKNSIIIFFYIDCHQSKWICKKRMRHVRWFVENRRRRRTHAGTTSTTCMNKKKNFATAYVFKYSIIILLFFVVCFSWDHQNVFNEQQCARKLDLINNSNTFNKQTEKSAFASNVCDDLDHDLELFFLIDK